MKIRGEIVGVTTSADHLQIEMQTTVETQADWYPLGRSVIAVPANAKNGRTYYVGRIVHLTMEPHQ